MADAVAAEALHATTPTGPSPLEGVHYDDSGDIALCRFVPVAVDDTVRSFVSEFAASNEQRRNELRAALTMPDLYTLLNFAGRAAIITLRQEQARSAIDGLSAVAAIEAARVDWRDLVTAVGVLDHALTSVGADVEANLRSAAALAEPECAARILRFVGADAEYRQLSSWGYVEVRTKYGVGLIRTNISSFSPQRDLVGIALDLSMLIDQDRYRTVGLTAGERLPVVWFPRSSANDVEARLDRIHGCVTVNTQLRPDDPAVDGNSGAMSPYQFTVFVAEAADVDDARHFAEWSIPTEKSNHAALAVAVGPVLALIVARSFVQGIAGIETNEALRRFTDPIRELLGGAQRS